jgi:hypothetical protein
MHRRDIDLEPQIGYLQTMIVLAFLSTEMMPLSVSEAELFGM